MTSEGVPVHATRHGAFNQLVVMYTDDAGAADLIVGIASCEILTALARALLAFTMLVVCRLAVVFSIARVFVIIVAQDDYLCHQTSP